LIRNDIKSGEKNQKSNLPICLLLTMFNETDANMSKLMINLLYISLGPSSLSLFLYLKINRFFPRLFK